MKSPRKYLEDISFKKEEEKLESILGYIFLNIFSEFATVCSTSSIYLVKYEYYPHLPSGGKWCGI